MNVELKLNNDTIMAVNSLLKLVYDIKDVSQEKDMKIVLSIIYEVSDMFDKKVKSQIKKATLFDNKKLTKITLKFYQAWALHQTLEFLIRYCDNTFKQTLIQSMINRLDQKLK